MAKKEQHYCGWCGQGLGFTLGFRNLSHSRIECQSNLIEQFQQLRSFTIHLADCVKELETKVNRLRAKE